MKKIIITLTAALLLSCTTLTGKSSTRIYSDFSAPVTVRLKSVTLEPSHILEGVSGELPGFIESCLTGCGFVVSEHPDAGVYEMEVFLHMKKWQDDFSARESVTLRFLLSRNGKPAAYRIYSEDTVKSIDSISWTFNLIDDNIREFSKAVYDEK